MRSWVPARRRAASVRDLADHHRDPFDRLLIAQAQSEGAALWTVDRALVLYGTPVAVL